MKIQSIKGVKLKKVMTQKEDILIAKQAIYNKFTGELESEQETIIRVNEIEARITKLKAELNSLKALKNKFQNEEFDEIEDKRSPKKTIVNPKKQFKGKSAK